MSDSSAYKMFSKRKPKTFWLALFCLGAIGYLCLLANAHIHQLENAIVSQVHQHFGQTVPEQTAQIETLLSQSVKSYGSAIYIAIICVFFVLTIVWAIYYKSEKRRVLLEQQSALGQTTSELSKVAAEKQHIIDTSRKTLSIYQNMLNALPWAVYWRDDQGRFIQANHVFMRTFETCENPVLLKEFLQNQQQIDNEVLQKDVDLLDVPETFQINGRMMSFLVSRIPIHNDTNENCGLVACFVPQDDKMPEESSADAPAEVSESEKTLPERTALIDNEIVEIPAVKEPERKHESPQNDPAQILIVDDVEENGVLLEVLLTKCGHQSTRCNNAPKAIEVCSQQRFDLILMDIQMPGMNGLEATQKIRAEGLNIATPIIAMTASNDKDDELKALDSGCDDYLSKPINRKLLEQKVWRSLQKIRQIKDAESGLDIVSFLDGNSDYQKAVETFVANLPQRVEDLKIAFDNHDMQDLAFKVHALKGLGGFAGFSVYTEKARELEEVINEKDIDKIHMLIDEIIQMCMRTRLKSDKT